ncbi:hypothetical protein Ndes2526B_g03410 [Nannochloris sp. 'desiccata']
MPAWHQDTDLTFKPSVGSEIPQRAQAGIASRKALHDAIPLTSATPDPDPGACSAEDRAYQAAIVADTALWRNKNWGFYYGGFWGPWFEEQFFKFWKNYGDGCPVNGRFYIPIYYNLAYRYLPVEERQLIGDYMATLDMSKQYFTILLLSKGMRILKYDPPAELDLMIFAAGGITSANKTTNVPLPLLIKEQHVRTPRLPKSVFASFAGTLETHTVRERLVELYGDLEDWEFYAPQLDNEIENWEVLMEQSVFCLAPRGFGTTSFRMYEALQLGCIPVYIWDEEIMLPFTEFLDWNSFSIIIEAKNIDQLGQRLKEADVATLLAGVEQVRHMMTYKYTMKYIVAYLESGMPGFPAEHFKTMPPGVVTF